MRDYSVNQQQKQLELIKFLDQKLVRCCADNIYNWIEEILQFKKHSLVDLTVSYVNLEQWDEAGFNNLLIFIKAQQPGFTFTIMTAGSSKLKNSGLKKYLDQKLVRGNAQEIGERTHVHIFGMPDSATCSVKHCCFPSQATVLL
uniref:STAS domain-containing protein n=1 Tax=Panagrellus redivivus TaxID=6233 RepID=A0A7E4V5X6_PANRE